MTSRFLSHKAAAITPYTPGEQPKDMQYIKLNTNECPYPPSPQVREVLSRYAAEELRLYPDPDNTRLTAAAAAYYDLSPEQVLVCGGSDEALAFAFMAFCNEGDSVCFADITYGFYQVYADLFGLRTEHIPLREDFSLCPEDYFGAGGTVFIANPNAPTGMLLQPQQIERILRANPDRVIVVDEAYIDFSPGCSCIPLLGSYENLLVVQTFSKSRALAGMRLGAAFGNPALIDGLNRIKYSFNPYNLDRISVAVGIAALQDDAYFHSLIRQVIATRGRTAEALAVRGFEVLPSGSNFLFARHPRVSGGKLYAALREKGILVRHFAKPRIEDYIRITIGSDSEMDTLQNALEALV